MASLFANWNAPSNVGALTTTRNGGISKAPYTNNNMALHVGDDPKDVQANRECLLQSLSISSEPVWLEQTHSNHCILVDNDSNRVADAAVTRNKNTALAIMTADCLPILLCNSSGTEIAAIHAGWRGLVNGIIENTLEKMENQPSSLIAWVGPAICSQCFEVGEEVWEAYISRYAFTKQAFQRSGAKYFANLAKMAELILNAQGVTAVCQSAACTFELKNQFYSYRREAQTGRMATLIWFKQG